ncbi:MAG: hypothetical protein NTV08_18890 [Verrucomicrobia bacterium]|nr:hypothetical protein [Verrucomicrobiota bacterium]
MSTLAEIESAVAALPRAEQAALLRFVTVKLGGADGGPVKTGGELARSWSGLPHLTPDEAADFERDLVAARAAAGGQAAPEWE